ncbi:MAG TPA: hypothetical protein VE869_05110, partial [Gemmatimonas sp.]|nr:hypothetical protein [Gemmatimonas sp.]
ESLEAAVFKALAKVPADRFTGAAPFADAIRTALTQPVTRPAQGVSPRRRALGMALYAAGLVAAGAGGMWASSTSRGGTDAPGNSAASGLSVTFSGDVVDFALTPDAQRLALGRLSCSDAGRCESLVEVRDVRGGIALPLARFRATYDMRWSRDGRFVDVAAIDSAGRFGTFRVSSLGGPVTYLGSFFNGEPVGSTDSLLVGAYSPRSVRLGVLLPGESALRDTMSFPDLRAWALSPDARRLLLVETDREHPLLRLVDRQWRTLDTLSAPSYYSHPRWSSSGDALFWIANDQEGLFVQRMNVDLAAGTFGGDPTQVVARFDMPQSFAGRRLDVADDGSIAYITGLTPRVLQLMARPRAGVVPSVVKRIETQVGRMRAFIAPDGATVAFSRLVPNGPSTADQLVHLDLASGVEREVSPRFEQQFVDAVWTPDGRALIYAVYEESVGTRLTRWDRASAQRREVGTYPGRPLGLIWALPDESLLTVGADYTSIERLAAGTGERVRRYELPSTQTVNVLAPAPDGTRAATMGWSTTGDSLVIGQLDLGSGKWREFKRMFGEGTGTMRWLTDGGVEFTLTSTVSTTELYRLDPRTGTVTRLGELPVPFAAYNFSADGKAATAVERRVVSDVSLLRPRR